MFNIVLRFIILIVVFLYMTSCGGPDLSYLKTQGLNKVAIISVQADSEIHLLNKEDFQNKKEPSLQFSELTQEEQFYLFDLMISLQKTVENWISKKGFTLISNNKLIATNTYKSLPSSSSTSTHYSLPPYKSIHTSSSNTYKTLANELEIDAMIILKTTFEKVVYRDPLQLPLTPAKLKLIANLMISVVDKNGTPIFEEKFDGASPESIDHDDTIIQFSLNHKKLIRAIDNAVINLKRNLNRNLNVI